MLIHSGHLSVLRIRSILFTMLTSCILRKACAACHLRQVLVFESAFSQLNKEMEVWDAFLTLAILSSMHNYRLFNLQQDVVDVLIKCKTLLVF